MQYSEREKTNNFEKLVVRKSMWDPVIRVYYDYKYDNNFHSIRKIIMNNLESMYK